MSNDKMMSAAEFKERFTELMRDLKDTDLVYFGNADLSLYRFKERGPIEGPRMVQIEFNEVYKVISGP